MPTANNCSLKSNNTVGSPAFSVCLAHTHTHTHTHNYTLTTGLVRIWFPTRHWEINCSLKETANIQRFLSFKSVRWNTLGTGWYKYGLSLKSREVRNPRGLVSPGKASKDDKNSKEDSGRWSSSPGMIPGGRSRSFVAQFQGIPSWV